MTARARITDAKLRRLARISLETRCALRVERDGAVTVLPVAAESVHAAPGNGAGGNSCDDILARLTGSD